MLEKWQRYVNNGKAIGTLMADLSKVFDYVDL